MSTLLAPTSRSSRLPSRFLVAGGLAALAAGGSLALALLSLHLADGVTFLGDSSYDTEFLDPAVLRLVPVLLPVLGLAAYYSGRVGLLALVGATLPLGYAAAESIRRTDEAGWSDGLEVLVWLLPIGLLLAGAIAWAVGVLAGRAARRR